MVKLESKKYLGSVDKPIEGWTLSWVSSGADISMNLEELKRHKLYRVTLPFINDKTLGDAMVVFQKEGTDNFYLEYSPHLFKRGCSYELPRKTVRLINKEKELRLPKRYYLLLD